MKEVYLAGGCFWDLQRYFDCVVGVIYTQTGFSNGNIMHPSYMEVCTGQTGFAETVKVIYDEAVLPLRGVLELYFKALNLNAGDPAKTAKPQHRLGVYYKDPVDHAIVVQYLSEMRRKNRHVIYVEIESLKNYYPAEEYHQHYLEKHPTGYCRIGREAFNYAGQYRV